MREETDTEGEVGRWSGFPWIGFEKSSKTGLLHPPIKFTLGVLRIMRRYSTGQHSWHRADQRSHRSVVLDHDLSDPITGNKSPLPLSEIQNALTALRQVLDRCLVDCQQSSGVRLAVLKSGRHKPVSYKFGFF